MALTPLSSRKAFKPSPYHSHRNSRGLPRWLILLVLGILLGGGGVIVLQASYGPKRLTVLESEKLTSELTTLNSKYQTLQNDFVVLNSQLENSKKASEQVIQTARDELAAIQKRLEPTEQSLLVFQKALTNSMSFDPIGIVSDQLTQSTSKPLLNYQILLLQRFDSKTAFNGQAEITFEGTYPNGRAGAVKTPMLELNVVSHQILQGTLDLPPGFTASKGTIRVFKSHNSRAVGWRTFSVQKGE